jgi:signal transduction histidine kinase
MNDNLSDEDSSQLIVKHLMDIGDVASDSESKLLYAAADAVKHKKTILRNSFLRALVVVCIGVVGVLVAHPLGYLFAFAVGLVYFAYDFEHSKRSNKQLEKLITLSADLDEKRHVLKVQNKLLNDKVNIISQFETIKEEKHRVQTNLANITSYNNHLTNIIRGVNHEVSPWLGSIGNIASLARDELSERIEKSHAISESDLELVKYLDEIKKAARQAADVLVLTSKNVKKLRNWSTSKSNLLDTIRSWGYIALMEHDIKGRLNTDNMHIDYKTLNFEAVHSPMLVSQIILNLVKNSIDHNEDFLDHLIVKIYGDGENTLFIEDNGKGIPANIINDIFKVGISTKKDSNLPSGLGLASTVDYCMLMNAIIRVESKVGKYTRFHIVFKTSNTDTARRVKDEDITRRSAYYQVIKEVHTGKEKDIITNGLADTPVEVTPLGTPNIPYQKTPSCATIEVVPVSNPDTEFRMRMVEIDETLKKLN